MDKLDRVYILHRELSSRRRPVTKARLAEAMGDCSVRTVHRTAKWMQDELHAPICFSPTGYFYDQHPSEPMFELPGLWFNEDELVALVGVQTLLQRAQPGLLDEYLAPIAKRIDQLLSRRGIGLPNWEHRIRIVQMAGRPAGSCFGAVADALARRQQILLRYRSRGDGVVSTRTVSPQRLTHYRENWYLDAWCHTKNALRTFSLDRIETTQTTDEPSFDVPKQSLDAALTTSFGIFAGEPTHEASLLFTARRAQWIADEQWHPQQQGERLADGRYRLRFPYHHSEELALDICRYGPDVLVEGPEKLREAVAERLKAAAALYNDGNDPERTKRGHAPAAE
ncbi:WYL domain-containing protein [Abyssibacter sp.]|uniref:helix-turn-helix transcriptional regulator n=1 Tax=Abyssibacter sp. TaxID=2320200 RepID=UPI0025BC9B7B|nr:WYL domain-containing protein [Abyssibacter sp.]MCK5859908.1 WYL domain-containing protein [Abyssibacter sp.]